MNKFTCEDIEEPGRLRQYKMSPCLHQRTRNGSAEISNHRQPCTPLPINKHRLDCNYYEFVSFKLTSGNDLKEIVIRSTYKFHY